MSMLGSKPCARPSIPPLFFAAVCAWAAVIAAETASWLVFTEGFDAAALLAPLACLGCALPCIYLALRRSQRARELFRAIRTTALVCACAGACAFACGLMYWQGWAQDVRAMQEHAGSEQTFELDLSSDASTNDWGATSNALARLGGREVLMRLMWPSDAQTAPAGHRMRVTGKVLAPEHDERGRWMHRSGIACTLKAASVEDMGHASGLRGLVTPFRDASFERISALGGDAAGLLAGILLGNRTLYAQSELEQAFQTTGLAHLMAVSGTHLAVVTMLIMVFLSRTPLKRRMRTCLLLIMLACYVALTGFSPSALRAGCMCGITMLAGLLKRRKSVLAALSLCAFALLGLSPHIAFSLGFELSVLAVLGLVLFSPLVQAWMQRLLPCRMQKLAEPVAATLAATLMTLPLTIPQFAQLPLVSPLANVLAAPLVTAALCVGMLGIVMMPLCAPIGSVVLGAASMIASASSILVRLLADLPGACIPLDAAALPLGVTCACSAALLWAKWPLPDPESDSISWKGSVSKARGSHARVMTTLVVIALVTVCAVAFPSVLGAGNPLRRDASRIVMLDVGQGDGMLIESKGACMLVDTGEDGEQLLRQLARQGITHLDAVLITHKDADHAGALKELAGVVGVGHVYVHADLIDQDFERSVLDAARWVTNGRGAEGVRAGDRMGIGEFALTVLAPREGGQSRNEDSLVSLVEYDCACDGSIEARGFLTGDAESDAVASVVSRVGDVDFLKVAHHGSTGGLTDEQLSTLSPELALISVGAENRYGHPTGSTLKQLEKCGSRVYRTDRQGAIIITFSEEGMTVVAEHGDR